MRHAAAELSPTLQSPGTVKCAVLWHVSHYLEGVHPKFGLSFHKYPKMDHDMPPGVCN